MLKKFKQDRIKEKENGETDFSNSSKAAEHRMKSDIQKY
jgi:hypothetical protein